MTNEAASAFIGRQAELTQLDAAWDRAVAGQPRLLLIGGDAGIGKTRLLREHVGRDIAGRVVAIGGCVPVAGGSLPFTPFMEILRTLTSQSPLEGGPAGALAAMAPAAVAELARLVPAIRLPADPHSATRAEPDAAFARARLFEAVLTFLSATAAESPLLLVIEDLHWADGSSRDLLSFLVRNLRTESILVLATYRTDELHRRHPLRSWVAEHSRLDAAERIDVGPIADDEMRADIVARLRLGTDPRLVDQIAERAEGNPLFAHELVASNQRGSDSGAMPGTLRDGFLERVGRLGRDALVISRHAAVFGRPVTEALLRGSTGLEADGFAAGIHEALDAQVLTLLRRNRGDEFELRHALLGEAIVEDLLPGERTELHRRIAHLLEAGLDGEDEPARIAGEIAHHLWAAHDADAAVSASVRAAIAAAETHAYAEAAAHWTRALEAWPPEGEVEGFDRSAALLRASSAAMSVGDRRRAQDLATKAVEMIDADSDPLRAALAHWQLGLHLATIDRPAASVHHGRAARLIEAADAPAAAARILARRALGLSERLQFDRAGPMAKRALKLSVREEIPTAEPEALAVLGWSRLAHSEHAAAVALMERSFDLTVQLRDPRGTLIQAGYGVCCALSSAGSWGTALERHERYHERIQELGAGRSWVLFLHDARIAALLGLGRWQEAASSIESLLAELETSEHPWIGALAAVVWARRGRVDEAASFAAIAAADPNVGPAERLAPVGCLAARAEVALARGRWAELRETVARAFATVPVRVRHAHPYLRPFVLLGLQAEAELAFEARIRRDGDAEAEAARTAGTLAGWMRNLAKRVTEAGEPLAAATLADAALAEALLTRVEHRSDPEAWRLALERCLAVGNPYDIARARHWLAEAILDRGGPRSEAVSELTLALATAVDLGAAGLERTIRDLARRGRLDLATAEVAESEGPADGTAGASEAAAELIEPLTPREREVLGFLASGWTNRRIGDALFISDKTVSVHVSNLLGKLGATNRAEAALIGDRLGLVASLDRP